MKLVTFQSLDALRRLTSNGYLDCDPKYINKKKIGVIYDWVVEKMSERIKNPKSDKYPIWAWVKCYDGICPVPINNKPKVEGFDVKITFHKPKEEVFVTDYRRFSFLLSNLYIPNSKNDLEDFNRRLKEANITEEELKAFVRLDKYSNHRVDDTYLQICSEIRKSFDRCITDKSDVLQACVWRINLPEVEDIEILEDDGKCYGSLNYTRDDGSRFDWHKDFYKKLKQLNILNFTMNTFPIDC